jgi:hypothetical protein
MPTPTGTTTVKDGTPLLNKDTLVVVDGAMSGTACHRRGYFLNSDVVCHLACCQLPDDTDVTINARPPRRTVSARTSTTSFSTAATWMRPAREASSNRFITVNRNTNSQAIISAA